jgi:uncharacterized iron-regulated protein
MAPACRALALGLVLVLAITASVSGVAASPLHPLCAHAPEDRARLGTLGRDLCVVIDTQGPDGRPAAWTGPPDGRPQALAAADILLLGEVHDNPLHHRLRAEELLHAGWHQRALGAPAPALVLEHIRTDQHLALAGFRALDRQRRRQPAAFFEALQWEKSGWPDARMFAPLIEAALDLEWPIFAGNVPRAEIRDIARQGLSILAGDERERLGLGVPFPEALQTALLDELEASHCGLMPKTAFAGLADAQRYRDAFMARALTDAAETHRRAILLAGNGHVRSDRGVPFHLRRMAPGKRIASVLFVEVEDAKSTVADYVQRGPDGSPVADFIYLTPGVLRADPCEEMRKHFRR